MCSLLNLVHTAHVHGPWRLVVWTAAVFMVDVFDTREPGPWTQVVCTGL